MEPKSRGMVFFGDFLWFSRLNMEPKSRGMVFFGDFMSYMGLYKCHSWA